MEDRKKLLIISENNQFVESLMNILKKNYQVFVTEDGRGVTYDLLISDREAFEREDGRVVIEQPVNTTLVLLQVENALLKKEQRKKEIDSLTGLPIRELFYEQTQKIVQRYKDVEVLVVCFDIDKLKLINDYFGRKKGNEVLIAIANTIVEALPMEGTCARLEADRFALCFPGSVFDVRKIHKKVTEAANQIIHDYRLYIKCGIYLVEDPQIPVDIMCDRAYMALQSVKENYGDSYVLFNRKIHDSLLFEQEIINEIEKAMQKKEIFIFLQPIYSISTMRPVSAEALVRWKHSKLGKIGPKEFIPVLEKNGYIRKLDYYVCEEVCKYLKERKDNGLEGLPVSVNMSAYTLYDPKLLKIIRRLTEKYKINPDLLKFEITESAYIDNPELLKETMHLLQKYGFTVMMDDFGSGYSSLNLLKNLEVDILKMDMRFLENFENSHRAGSIFTSVIRMAKWLNIPVIAEGVETKAQLDFLRGVGCDRIQGYYFSKPLMVKEFEKHILENKSFETNTFRIVENEKELEELFYGSGVLTRIFNSLAGCVLICEYTGEDVEIIRVNDRYYEIMGYNPHALFSKRKSVLSSLHSKEDKDKLLEACKRASLGRNEDGILLRFHHEDGQSMVWMDTNIHLLGGSEKSYIISITGNDITQQIQHEKIIESLYDSLPCGVIKFIEGDKKKIIELNSVAARIYGYDSQEEFWNELLSGKEFCLDYSDRNENNYKINLAIETGEPQEIKCRIEKKNNEVAWIYGVIRHTGTIQGEACMESVFMEITDTVQKTRNKIRMEEILRMILVDKEFIVFDYDPDKDEMKLLFSKKGEAREMILENCLDNFTNQNIIAKDQRKEFVRVFDTACKISTRGEFEFRGRFKGKKFRWYRAEYKSISDEKGKVFRFLGRVYDINEEKENVLILSEKAEKDDLSGLLNRTTAKFAINKILKLEKNERYAFFIIDIDKFKNINDNHGHPKGDEVIREIGKALRKEFRQEDIVARIGGDEFLAFFPIKKSEEYAYKKASSLIKKVRSIEEEQGFQFKVSVSLGISFAPEEGENFDTLFVQADKAMYMAKEEGGDCYRPI